MRESKNNPMFIQEMIDLTASHIMEIREAVSTIRTAVDDIDRLSDTVEIDIKENLPVNPQRIRVHIDRLLEAAGDVRADDSLNSLTKVLDTLDVRLTELDTYFRDQYMNYVEHEAQLRGR